MTKGASENLKWWARALARSVTGFFAGLMVFGLLAVLTTLVPDIRDASMDLGMAWKQARVTPELSRPEAKLNDRGFGYVLLDIDPGDASSLRGPSASEAACAAVPRAVGEAPLSCPSLRSPNRHLLAELSKELQRRGARLIVIDVMLGRDAFPFAPDETQALADVLDRQTIPTILYAAPLQPLSTAAPGLQVAAAPGRATPILPDGLSRGLSGSVLLTAERPVRRYPPCVAVRRSGGGFDDVPALPLLAAARLSGEDPRVLCRAWRTTSPPRIDFTLGPRPDQDASDALGTRGLVRSGRIYRRCLAENFWNPRRVCGDEHFWRGKVVIIGATSLERGDQFITPIGMLSGGEVLINAIRTFVAAPRPSDTPGPGAEFGRELAMMGISAAIWWTAWLVVEFSRQKAGEAKRGHKPESPRERWRARFWRGLRVLACTCAFFLAAIAVTAATLAWNFAPAASQPRIDVLVPMLAVGLELFLEGAGVVLRFVERFVAGALGSLRSLRQVPENTSP